MSKPLVVDIGSLRKQLVIESLPDPASQSKVANWNEPDYSDWSDAPTAPTVWGSVEPLSGRELVFASEVVSDATHLVTIWYFQGLNTRQRFKYVDDVTGDTRYFNIEYIKDVNEEHVFHTCYCREAA